MVPVIYIASHNLKSTFVYNTPFVLHNDLVSYVYISTEVQMKQCRAGAIVGKERVEITPSQCLLPEFTHTFKPLKSLTFRNGLKVNVSRQFWFYDPPIKYTYRNATHAPTIHMTETYYKAFSQCLIDNILQRLSWVRGPFRYRGYPSDREGKKGSENFPECDIWYITQNNSVVLICL